MAEETATDTGEGGTTKPDPTKKKQLKNEHILIIIGILGVVVSYVYMKRASANAANTSATSATVPVTSSGTGSSGGGSSSYMDYMLMQQLQQLQQQVATGYGTGSSASTGGSSAPGSTPAPGQTPTPNTLPPGVTSKSFNGASYLDFAQLGVGSYDGYNVGGNAPVYYNPPGTNQLLTNLSPAAVRALPAGTQLYVPQSFDQYIGTQQVVHPLA